MTRKERIRWSQARARKYFNDGEIALALVSMVADLRHHKETKTIGERAATTALMMPPTRGRVKRFIDSFD